MVPLICRVHVRAPPRSSWLDGLADGRLHERRPGEVEAAALGHQQLVAQHRQVAAAGDAVAHDGRELRNARGRDDGVVAEDAAEVVLVGKDLVLQAAGRRRRNRRGKRAAGDCPSRCAGRAAPSCTVIGKERAGLHGGVVGDDHDAPPHSVYIFKPPGPISKNDEPGSMKLVMRSRAVGSFGVLSLSSSLCRRQEDGLFLFGEVGH